MRCRITISRHSRSSNKNRKSNKTNNSSNRLVSRCFCVTTILVKNLIEWSKTLQLMIREFLTAARTYALNSKILQFSDHAVLHLFTRETEFEAWTHFGSNIHCFCILLANHLGSARVIVLIIEDWRIVLHSLRSF